MSGAGCLKTWPQQWLLWLSQLNIVPHTEDMASSLELRSPLSQSEMTVTSNAPLPLLAHWDCQLCVRLSV